MKLVVGLGNPGPKYETTRHNVGWIALDRLAIDLRANPAIKKGDALVQEVSFNGEKVLLVKPLTFMNLSGKAVAPLYRFYQCKPTDLVVLHDEIDLVPLSVKVKTGGGNAGHNGLRSIDASIGGDQTGYHRVRIGVGKHEFIPVADFVLQRFSDAEFKALDQTLDWASQATQLLLKDDPTAAMNFANGKKPAAFS